MARPGSRDAASRINTQLRLGKKTVGAFTRSSSGVWVPDRSLVLATAKDMHDQARWQAIRRGVFRHLKSSGARMSPEPYQKLVQKIRRRAQIVLRKEGKSLGSWKMMVLEGGKADQVNAAAWTGGVITIYRPLVDLCYQIANVVVNTKSPTRLDRELWNLSRWRGNKAKVGVPDSLKVSQAKLGPRDKIAESILSRVVLHEMGHGASGHVEFRDRKLIIPGQDKPFDAAASRVKEREADLFAATLGTKGAVRVPGVMPLFSYYNFISRPNFDERGKNMVADWRSHPLDAERYNNQRKVLEQVKRTKGLPQPLEPRIIMPNGRYSTPSQPTPDIRPAPARVQQPLRKAAAR